MAPTSDEFTLFALGTRWPFAEAVSTHLGCAPSSHEDRAFDFGERKIRPLVEVGRRDVFVLAELQGELAESVNDKLMRLLLFVGALKDAGAGRVTAVVPYLPYSRKDRRTKARDPVSSRYVATLFEAMQLDCLVTCDVHNVAAFENAFRRCRTEHVPLAGVFADHFAQRFRGKKLAVVAPDTGGDKRAELFRTELERRTGQPVAKALLDKHRSMGVVSGTLFAGDVAGCTAIIIDDMIASGATIVRAAEACRKAGAERVVAAAAHGLFAGGAPVLAGAGAPDSVLVSDTVRAPELSPGLAARLDTLTAAPLVAEVIRRLHCGGAVTDLLPYD